MGYVWTEKRLFALRARSGFTLFEVAISMALVTFGVVSVLMFLPSGLKAQHHARQQIYASIMMQNLSSWFVEPAQIGLNLQVESRFPTNNQYMRRGLHDLETIAESTGIGLCPVPIEIAHRLDSENDEIRKILAAGGRLYYSKAGGPPQQPLELGEMYDVPGGPPQTLIIGILGSPQLNAVPNHPCNSWPYWDNHPMAPAKWELDNWAINSVKDGTDLSGPPWECYGKFKELYDVFNSEKNATGVDYATWKEYVKKAGELVIALNIPLEMSDYSGRGPVPLKPQPYPTNGDSWQSMSSDSFDPRPDYVWAISHLAHAASLATAVFTAGGIAPQTEDITYAKLTYEVCVAWVRRATVANPYNYGVARHLSTATAWNYPLLQYDVFPTASLPLFGQNKAANNGNGNTDIGYRLVSPIPVTHYGQARGKYSNGEINVDSISHDSPPTIPSSSNYFTMRNNWGDPNHFVITRQFNPSERMRQVVFWSVDWQSYVDFESLSAPEHDASMCFVDSFGKVVNADRWGNYLPEKELYWIDEKRTKVLGDTKVSAGSQGAGGKNTIGYKAGKFMGMWGADRNSNKIFDRGVVPISVRMYAMQIARFPIYDRILVSDGRL